MKLNSVRRSWLAGAGASVLAVAVAHGAHAQTSAMPHVTRTVQIFTQLEESLLQSIRTRDDARLQALVDDEFEMVVAQAPDAPVPRQDWLASVRKPGAGDFSVEQMSVREIVAVAVVSFVLRPKGAPAKSTPVFVVDTWQRDDKGWHLTQRHAAPVAGSRRAIPGDSGKTGMPKQI